MKNEMLGSPDPTTTSETEASSPSGDASVAGHTPGPWSFDAADHRPDWFVLHHSDGAGCQREVIGGCHNEADARLIAAAPKMLDALRLAQRALLGYRTTGEAMVAIEAALAKVRP